MLIWTHLPCPPANPFVFLDRDGVLNVDSANYIRSWQEFHFYQDALDALRFLDARRVNVVVVSNQSVLNRGYTTYAAFWEMHVRMIRQVGRAGGRIGAAFYCPHRPDEQCRCRKPAPGMIREAARLLGIDLDRTILIGDRVTDQVAAERAGCRAVLLDRPGIQKATPEGTEVPDSTPRFPDLMEAVRAIFPG